MGLFCFVHFNSFYGHSACIMADDCCTYYEIPIMKFFALVGQPKTESSPVVLDCIDEDSHTVSPMHLEGMKAKYEKSGHYERLAIMPVELDQGAVRRALFPEEFAGDDIPADKQE